MKMEIWILENAKRKINFLRSMGRIGRGLLIGHKRGDSFIVEDILQFEDMDLKSPDFISFLNSSALKIIGFFSSSDEEFKNIPQYLYGNAILLIKNNEIAGFFVDFTEENHPFLKKITISII
ncbi:MAG: hypothetical protein ACUVUG_00385 [Candidatus Aminicenantia bacterium]